jgi:hypothetical protein
MDPTIAKTCRMTAIIALLWAPAQSVLSHTVNIYKKNFSGVAEHMMHEHTQKARYVIPMNSVSAYLPTQHDIKRTSIKLINDRMLPGKTPLRLGRYFIHSKKEVFQQTTKNIFGNLEQEKPHTYVVLPEEFIFTESTANPTSEIIKDKFTKHYIISGLAKKVNYSGEFLVYKNSTTSEVFVIFDNSSGTYQPPTELLPSLQKLLENNLNSTEDDHHDKIYILTKTYKQKIDKEKLFNHDPNPFVKAETI